ncbi:MAG: hypothetical protein PHT40_03870 [Patescibacteria group bacterium]|nr:hypothetical protein [Patescibacteria group bacterium]
MDGKSPNYAKKYRVQFFIVFLTISLGILSASNPTVSMGAFMENIIRALIIAVFLNFLFITGLKNFIKAN